MSISKIFFQFKKAAYHITRLLPKKIQRYVFPILAFTGIFPFYNFMIRFSGSPILIVIKEWIIDLQYSPILPLVVLIAISALFLLIRKRRLWKLISLLYLIITIIGLLPKIQELIL